MSDPWLVKRCSACATFKPVSDFHRDGLGYQPWCKPCRKAYDAAYHQRVRPRRTQQKLAAHERLASWHRDLKARPCTDCGGSFHPAAMQWDHLPGKQKTTEIAEMLRRNLSRKIILEEIAKCELVCANCHAMRTWRRVRERRERGVAQPGSAQRLGR